VSINALKKAAQFAFADGGSIKARVLRSGLWVGLSEIGLQALSLIRSVVLARLLTPEAFGVMGLAMIVVRAVETFTRPGVAQALIARQQSFEEAASTAYTMLVARGFILAALLAALAPLVGRFYESSQLVSALQALCLLFVVGGFANINTIARQRELDFRRLTYLAQTTTLTGTLITIGVAYWVRSVWALVIGQLATVSLNTLLSYVFLPGRPRLAFDRAVARDLLAYGKFITGSSIILYIATELDTAVVGKVLGPEQVGFYTLAFMLTHLVTANLAKIASSVMMPAYAKLQTDRPALRHAFLRTMSLVLMVVTPITVGLIALADPLIEVVYGEKWVPAVIPLQLLAVFGWFRSVAAFNGYLFEGMGKPGIAFRLGVIRLALIAPAMVPATYAWGLAGAGATVIVGIAAQWVGGLFYLRSELDIRPGEVLRLMARPWLTSLVMGLAAAAVVAAWPDYSVISVGAAVLCGMLVYAVLNLRSLIQLARERVH
jgi:O-antigen/teichoic acid export membrane protein